ncbi:DUF1330 domain-containing protein [Sphingomonas canadensis]|uniref:DUF1330 domain-containing protein n=1 Tax=Sphingomonas canadensis TaxID=1219257 RepID=A0ABW3HDY0_9SPHN|nr:DUF1330 domain-containing protein [Sphingomonas canadensis]MCW3838038.1 DUF1330 domain-containing protein [Sphingomonas canadensis]
MRKAMLAGAAMAIAAAGAWAGAAWGSGQAAPKAYIVARMSIHDPAGFARYAPQVPAVLAMHGGRYLARAGRFELLEGAAAGDRAVILEFPSMDAARAFYYSPEYQAIAPIRRAATEGGSFIVEGVAP